MFEIYICPNIDFSFIVCNARKSDDIRSGVTRSISIHGTKTYDKKLYGRDNV